MLLALDIGNTNIVAGIFQGDVLQDQWRLSTQRERTADELAVFLRVAFEAHDWNFREVRGVVISSVVPSLTPAASRMAQKYFACEPVVVNGQTHTGLQNCYDNPAEVGADRLVNSVAAWKKYHTACVIADFGTATTVDAVSHDGKYLGGALSPGVQISTNALFAAAARLPRVERLELIQPPPQTLGRNTLHSVQAGILYGYAGLVKELVSRCVEELQTQHGEAQVTTIATGGLAEAIAPLVPQIQHIEPHLTLDGLRLIWEMNQVENSRS
jgi:type III pantothenate kinase